MFACLLFGTVVVDCTAMQAQTTTNDSPAQIQQDDTSADFSHDSFWKAARNGDLEHVRAALESGIDVNVKTNYGATALFFACDRGQAEVVKFLLEHDADPNIKDTFYNATPVAWAQMKGNSGIVLMLLRNGAKDADSILLSAATQGKTDFVRQIIATKSTSETGRIDARDAAMKLKDEAGRAELLEFFESLDLPDVETLTIPEILINKYAGRYTNADLAVDVIAANKGIRLKINNELPKALAAQSDTRFKSGKNVVRFEMADDKVTGLKLKLGEREFELQRIRNRPKQDAKPSGSIPETKAAGTKPAFGPSRRKSLTADQKVASRNWPGFRGVGSRGVVQGQQPPTKWSLAEQGNENEIGKSANENIIWKSKVPGLGLSCPTIWGNRIYLTTAVTKGEEGGLKIGLYGDVASIEENREYEYKVLCYSKSNGNLLWERTAIKSLPKVKRHAKSSHANPTVATNGELVVAFFGSEGLYCFTKNGGLVWERDLGFLDSGWFYDPGYQWGFASSPVIHGDTVFVQCDVHGQSFVEAFDLKTGKSNWRTDRDEIPGWSTPLIHQFGDRTLLITNGTNAARAYDVNDGSLVWSLEDHSEIVVPTPNVAHDLIFVSSGYSPIQPIYAIKPNANGDISLPSDGTNSEMIQWSVSRGGPYLPTPVIYGDYLYCCSNNGILTCYFATTGDVVYKQRLRAKGGTLSFTASPIAGDGHLFLTAEDGRVLVIKAGPEFQLEEVNQLGESILATPAVSRGAMFFRTQNSLIAVGKHLPPKKKSK